MHPDIEKLIKMAGEGAGLTPKKREIILRKTQELGEDTAEVEMYLEILSETPKPAPVQPKPAPAPKPEPVPAPAPAPEPKAKPAASSAENRRRCPNCGEVISDYTLVCPQCGYALDSESATSNEVQARIDEFHARLMDVNRNEILRKNGKKLALIHGFSVPMTKEALVLGFSYAKTQFLSAADSGQPTAEAWRTKLLQFHDLLEAQPSLDDRTMKLIEDNEYLFSYKLPEKKYLKFARIALVLAILFTCLIFFLIMIDGGF